MNEEKRNQEMYNNMEDILGNLSELKAALVSFPIRNTTITSNSDGEVYTNIQNVANGYDGTWVSQEITAKPIPVPYIYPTDTIISDNTTNATVTIQGYEQVSTLEKRIAFVEQAILGLTEQVERIIKELFPEGHPIPKSKRQVMLD